MINVLLISAVILVVLLGLVRYLENKAVFYASHLITSTPAQIGLVYEDIYITTLDRLKINAWLIKHPQAKSTIIFAHGNAGNMSDRLLKMRAFYNLGLNVMAFDYRGYGKSGGNPTEKGIYRDAQAVYDYLMSRQDMASAKVIAYGASLGGVVAVDLAFNRPVNALIVDSSITRAKDMAKILYPYLPYWLMQIQFDSLSKIKAIAVPKLFIHSRQDRIVPFWMGEKLFKETKEPKQFFETTGGHNDSQVATDIRAIEALRTFLQQWELL